MRAVHGHTLSCVSLRALHTQFGPRDRDLPTWAVHGIKRCHLAETLRTGLRIGRLGLTASTAIYLQPAVSFGQLPAGLPPDADAAIWIGTKQACEEGCPFFLSASGALLTPGLDGALAHRFLASHTTISDDAQRDRRRAKRRRAR